MPQTISYLSLLLFTRGICTIIISHYCNFTKGGNDPDTVLIGSVLQTIAPPWYVRGTELSPEYAAVLEDAGLVEKAELDGYKLTYKGYDFYMGDPLSIDESVAKEVSDKLKAFFYPEGQRGKFQVP